LSNLLSLYGFIAIAGVEIGSGARFPAEDVPPNGDPRSYVEFVANLDGKCYMLSAGGRLQSIKNNHLSKTIRYRLVRYFAGRLQPSLAAGTVGPAGQTKPLGCDRVDGRDQTWRLESARYVD